MTLTVGSLFSGIGGLDLGLERAGMEVIWQSEINPYACKVLNKHWKEVPNLGNIKEIKWDDIRRPDVICGGYPCQPFSTAGKRRGENDPRHLFPYVLDGISRLRPRYAILENVRGHLTLGGTTVIGELARIGYDAEWRIVSAASVGANHRRDRIIIVAYPNGQVGDTDSQSRDQQCEWEVQEPNTSRSSQDVSNAPSELGNGVYYQRRKGQRPEAFPQPGNSCWEDYEGWRNWQTEPNVGRVADGISSRVDRLRCLGNAVVPQVAEVIGRLVMAHANHDTPNQ